MSAQQRSVWSGQIPKSCDPPFVGAEHLLSSRKLSQINPPIRDCLTRSLREKDRDRALPISIELSGAKVWTGYSRKAANHKDDGNRKAVWKNAKTPCRPTFESRRTI